VSVRVGPRPLSVAAAYRELEDAESGGVVVFVGRVRPDRLGPGRSVAALEYEAHRTLAERALEELARGAQRRFRVRRSVLWHRVGVLPVGTPSVIVGAATGHRDEAFRAARWMIDELKAKAPIWKMDRARSARRRRPRPSPRAGR
jgi:molybdopterin synthase catalytic subunit